MVMAQSLFITLYRQYDNAQIDVLAPAWSRPILEAMPEVHQAIDMPVGHGALQLKVRKQLARTLKKNSYDWAIILPNSFKSALIPWWAGIPKRTGWKGEFRYGVLNDIRKLDKSVFTMTVQRYVGLAYPKNTKPDQFECPPPNLHASSQHIEAAMQSFKLDKQRPVLALCPGAEFGRSKKWPERHFAEIARQHIRKGGQVWLFGSQNDRASCDDIAQAFEVADIKILAGETSLQQAVALLSQADQVVANDSGLMHVAAALARPVVAIYGSTPESYTPPLSKQSIIVHTDIECRPCRKRECPYGHYRCLEDLKPELVTDALQKITPSVV